MKETLILGVGNVLLADDGVGVHIVRKLQHMDLPEYVEVIDGGTQGFELINYFQGKKKIIILDALKTDAKPGSVYRFTPEDIILKRHESFSAHQSGLNELLYFARELIPRPEIIIYGIAAEDYLRFGMDLSPAVENQLERIIDNVIAEIS